MSAQQQPSKLGLDELEHRHDDHDHGEHDHTHGLVDRSILRSHAGVQAVGLSLLLLGLTAGVQVAIFAFSNSVALLADFDPQRRRCADGDPARDRVLPAQRAR